MITPSSTSSPSSSCITQRKREELIKDLEEARKEMKRWADRAESTKKELKRREVEAERRRSYELKENERKFETKRRT